MSIETLYLCEKPSQAKDIARMLGCSQRGEGFIGGKDISVTWCIGHLLESARPDFYCENIKPWRMAVLPVVPDSWQMTVKENTQKQFKVIKSLLAKTKRLVIATDADREGEVIAREILDICEFKGIVQRLWLSALDDASIQKALSQLREGKSTENLYQAGLGRQRADWLIGMNMTIATSALFGNQAGGLLSVGRVQTPALKLVVDRDDSIHNFKPKNYFELFASFETQHKETFTAKWETPEDKVDESGHCLDQTLVEQIAQKIERQKGIVQKFENNCKKQASPLCLSLSELQKLASSRYGLSVQKTLEIAQSLYETHKATSYPRTDCGYLPLNQFQEAQKIVSELEKFLPDLKEVIKSCDLSFKSPTWNDKKVTAHHGIIPTQNSHVDTNKMTDDERKLYELICRYYLAQFLGDYEYAQRSVVVKCEGEIFKASSHTPLKLGWKKALERDLSEKNKNKNKKDEKDAKDEKEEKEEKTVLPALKVKEAVDHRDNELLTKKTKPLSHFTEGTLIDAMKSISRYLTEASHKKLLKETAGIGTEATRANIIETLLKREYLTKKGKLILSTDKGKTLIKLLPTMVCDPVMTAKWEEKLESISQGKGKLSEFLDEQTKALHQMLSDLKQVDPPEGFLKVIPCPKCAQPLKIVKSKKTEKLFWGCSNYPECKFVQFDHKK